MGEGNGWFDAFDAKNGTRVWRYNLGAGVNAPPVTYQVNGEQYVAVAAGGNFQMTYPYGDTVAIFKLPASAKRQAAMRIPKTTTQGEPQRGPVAGLNRRTARTAASVSNSSHTVLRNYAAAVLPPARARKSPAATVQINPSHIVGVGSHTAVPSANRFSAM